MVDLIILDSPIFRHGRMSRVGYEINYFQALCIIRSRQLHPLNKTDRGVDDSYSAGGIVRVMTRPGAN
jgi:hypothetical protein